VVDRISGNTLYAVEQNVATTGEVSAGRATYTITSGVLSRDQSVGLAIRGIVHDPDNLYTNGSSSRLLQVEYTLATGWNWYPIRPDVTLTVRPVSSGAPVGQSCSPSAPTSPAEVHCRRSGWTPELVTRTGLLSSGGQLRRSGQQQQLRSVHCRRQQAPAPSRVHPSHWLELVPDPSGRHLTGAPEVSSGAPVGQSCSPSAPTEPCGSSLSAGRVDA
jgi:hypothetical protein